MQAWHRCPVQAVAPIAIPFTLSMLIEDILPLSILRLVKVRTVSLLDRNVYAIISKYYGHSSRLRLLIPCATVLYNTMLHQPSKKKCDGRLSPSEARFPGVGGGYSYRHSTSVPTYLLDLSSFDCQTTTSTRPISCTAHPLQLPASNPASINIHQTTIGNGQSGLPRAKLRPKHPYHAPPPLHTCRIQHQLPLFCEEGKARRAIQPTHCAAGSQHQSGKREGETQ